MSADRDKKVREPERAPRTPAEAEQVLKRLAGALDPVAGNAIPSMAGVIPSLPDPQDKLTGQLYQILLEQIPAVTFITSFEQGLQKVYVSPQIGSILGYTPDEWLANPSLWYDRLHPEERERWNHEFAATVVSRGTAVREVYRFLHRDGRTVWILGDVRIRRDESGQPLFVQAVGFDVTEIEEAKAREIAAQNQKIRRLQSEVQREFGADQLVGSSEAMRKLRVLIHKVARSDASALITGESGTGKELVARALHYSGRRKDKPFVAVNCGAFPDATLLDDALFGHKKGAFTDAKEDYVGRLQEADGGTLFLDEIGNMPLLVQDKILRFIQELTLRPLGSNKDVNVNVRIIAATHKDLPGLIKEGKFKVDLYYKLKVVSIEVPALRERAADIPELAEHFLARANRVEKREVKISQASMPLLKSYSWSDNNVRELEHAIEGAVVLCDGETILPKDLPAAVAPRDPQPLPEAAKAELAGVSLIEATLGGAVSLNAVVEHLEVALITAALEKSGWVKADAARLLGIPPRVLDYKITNLGIKKTQV